MELQSGYHIQSQHVTFDGEILHPRAAAIRRHGSRQYRPYTDAEAAVALDVMLEEMVMLEGSLTQLVDARILAARRCESAEQMQNILSSQLLEAEASLSEARRAGMLTEQAAEHHFSSRACLCAAWGV